MAEIQLTDLTTGTVDGTGVFDKLMVSVSAQLTAELAAKRITKNDYAAVYTATIAAVLNTANNFLLNKQASDKQAEVLTSQKLLTDEQKLTQVQQTALATQKVLTEQAQVLDTVSGNTVVGLIGKQKDLYQQQIDGYQRDAEQKAAKILADRWNLSRSTDSGFSELGTGLENNNIQAMMAKLFTGVGVTQIVP